ncbi:hypothetical protein WMY93_033801 [Mugilogobius chulae]|uniref:Uncharacterized protein n=1 Tax=Mugilogobius chulae TaxID=88201 RepID=A0AAW0MK03_9GOBI
MFEKLRKRFNAGARVRELEQLLQASEEEKQTLQAQLSDKEKTVDKAKKLLRQLERKNSSLKENVEKMEEVEYENQRLKVQECELRGLLVAKEEEISLLKGNISEQRNNVERQILDLEEQLTYNSQMVRRLRRDLTLAEKAVREQLSEINNLEEKLEQETTQRQDLEAQLQQLSKKDEDVCRENVLLRKNLDEELQKTQELEAQLTYKCQMVRRLGSDLTLAEKAVREQVIENNNLEESDLTLAEKAVREQVIENDNLEERLEQETTLRQYLEAELHKLKEERERKVEFTETSLRNESLQEQLVVQQQKITQLEELVSKKDARDNILEKSRENEGVEEQQRPETTESRWRKEENYETQLYNAQETITELEPNRSHLEEQLQQEQAQSQYFYSCLQELHCENQDLRRALQAEQEERENETRERVIEEENTLKYLDECQRWFDHNLQLLDEERNNIAV